MLKKLNKSNYEWIKLLWWNLIIEFFQHLLIWTLLCLYGIIIITGYILFKPHFIIFCSLFVSLTKCFHHLHITFLLSLSKPWWEIVILGLYSTSCSSIISRFKLWFLYWLLHLGYNLISNSFHRITFLSLYYMSSFFQCNHWFIFA